MAALVLTETGVVIDAETLCQFLDDEEIGTNGRWRLDQLGAEQDMLLAAGAI
ncbi:hypothetical protein D3C86_2171510 [compost metagenome]